MAAQNQDDLEMQDRFRTRDVSGGRPSRRQVRLPCRTRILLRTKATQVLPYNLRVKNMFGIKSSTAARTKGTGVAADMSVGNQLFLEVTTSTGQIKRPDCYHQLHCLCSKGRQSLQGQCLRS